MPASKAALAAGKQGKFWEMHAKLFANMRELTPDNFKKWAGELTLDVARFEKDMASPEMQAQIDKEMARSAHRRRDGHAEHLREREAAAAAELRRLQGRDRLVAAPKG